MLSRKIWKGIGRFLLICGAWIICGADVAAYERPSAITVAIVGNLEPYSYTDRKGALSGQVKDLWDLWASRTGVAVSYQILDWSVGVDLLKSGGIDVIGVIPERPSDSTVQVSEAPLVSAPVHAFYDEHVPEIADEESLTRHTVGVVAGGACGSRLSKIKNAHLRNYSTFDELLDAVGDGEVNVFCCGRREARRRLESMGLGSAFRVSQPMFEAGLHWATRASDPDLHRFITDGFASISETERQRISDRWAGSGLRPSAAEWPVRKLMYFLLLTLAMIVGVVAWNISLRQKVNARTRELRATETRFAAILNNLPEAAWIKDLDGHYLAANLSLQRMCGVSDPGTIIGQTDFDLFEPKIAEVYRRNDAMVLGRMAPTMMIEPFGNSDGSVRWVESTKAPVFDDNGRCVGTVGLSRDITCRKNAEDSLSLAIESLRASESRFRDLLSTLPVGVFEIDSDGIILFANDVGWAMLGNPLERRSVSLMSHAHSDDCFSLVGPMRLMLDDGMAFSQEFRLVSASGDQKWVQALGVKRADTGGAVISMLDIDERRLAEERLRAREEEFRALAELSPDTIARYDVDARRIYANPTFVALAGVPVKDLLGKTPSQDRPTPELRTYENQIREVAATGKGAVFELAWTDRNRQPVVSEIRLVPQYAGNDAIVGVVAVGRDVTRMKAIESELRQQNAKLAAILDNLPGSAYTMRYGADGRKLLSYTAVDLGEEHSVPQTDEAFRQNFHPDDHVLLFVEVPMRLRRMGFSEHKFRFLRADGSTVWLHAHERLRAWEGGDMIVDGLVFDVTEEMESKAKLERTSAELRETAGRLATLVDNLPGMAYRKEYRPEGSLITYTSAGFRDLMGRDFQGGSDQGRLDTIWYPEDHDKIRGCGEAIRNGADQADVKVRFIHADGSVRWVLLRERVVDRRGEVIAAEGLMLDITSEVEAKQSVERQAEDLRATAQRLGAILDNLPGLAYRKEYGPDQSRITYVSGGYKGVFGRELQDWSFDERLALHWHPDDHDKLRAYSESIRSGADSAELRLRFIRADGNVGWTLMRERVVDRRADMVAAEGLLIDITSEMMARQAFEANADEFLRTATKLQTLVNNLPGVIFRMEYVSPERKRMLEVFGKSDISGELLSEEQMRATVHPDDVDLVYRQFHARLREEGEGELVFRKKGNDGRWHWVQTRERVVERMGDRLIVEGQVIDITAEILTKKDLEESEKRRQRAEARLREGSRFEALGQFAGGIAHDFNNLLGAMLGYAQFIAEDAPPGSNNRRHAIRITEIGEKGRMIVDQILNYSRRSELIISRFKISELISDIASFWGEEAGGGPLLEVDEELKDLEVEADRVHLNRMLMNLSVNARDAMDGQPGTVSIGAHQAEFDTHVLRRLIERDELGDGGDVEAWTDGEGNSWVVAGRLPKVLPHVSLYVADTGQGMEAKLMEQAFKPFFTTKDRSRGTGLGLSVVHGVVMAHGGAIIGRSRPGHGTRFDILLPVRRTSNQAVDVFVPVPETKQVRVLLVDDHADVLDAMSEALRRCDYFIDAHGNPAEALKAFRAAPDQWDIVITDQVMPIMRGIDLIKAVRKIRPDLPCVLCSGYSDEMNNAACADAGVTKMLRKPVGMNELTAAIETNVRVELTNG